MKKVKITLNYLVYVVTIVFAFINTGSIFSANDGSRYTSQSVLNTSSGKWVKLMVEKNAIYKLTYEDIQKLGIDPSKAKIYGYGGWPLDEDFTQPSYVDDLPEVSCWVSGNDDTLDSGEYLLFYGRGTVKWSYSQGSTNEYVHENNSYSTYGTYFLTDATPGAPKRMETKESSSSPTTTLTSFEDYIVHENDVYSHSKTGREFYGECFSGNNTQSFPFSIPGIEDGNGTVSLAFVSNVTKSTKLTLKINNSSAQFNNFIEATIDPPANTTIVAVSLEKRAAWGAGTTKNENTIVEIDHPCGASPAYLNYIRLNMLRKLQYYNVGYTFFRHSENLKKSVKYNIQNASENLLVFDITGNYGAKLVQTTFDGSTKILSFNSESGALREFALVDPQKDFDTPQKLSDVEPQNLHGSEQTEMVIITPKAFVSEAERLAQKHRTHSGLKVKVATSEQIYNEFSSGTPDATAYRRFMKMFYDRGVSNINDNSLKPKYLLLFGDGMWDNRFLDPTCKGFNKDNFLLTYQVKESLKTDESYSCDDYFGFLEESEEGNKYMAKKLSLGIGRFPVQSLANSKKAVDKTINYIENKNLGIWKNSIVMLADDSDDTLPNQSFTLHMKQADSIAYNVMQKKFPEFMVKKIYMDAYKPTLTGGTKSFPNTRKELEKCMNEGCLIFNYTGHGGPTGFADGILTISDVYKMNFPNLPLWITASCEFAWFDRPTTTAGEEAFLSESAGIALFTTTRVVYAQDNLKLNYAMMQNLFTKKNNTWPTLGDAVKDCKNSFTTNNSKMNYLLIGDPALTLNYPENQIEIDKIKANGVELTENPAVLKALDEITVSGYVKTNENKIDDSFNGMLSANVFDGIQTVQTVTAAVNSGNNTKSYSYFTDYPNLLSPSNCEVKNGRFEFSFAVMADITNIQSFGKMNLYAYDINSKRESNGSFMNYNVLGINENANILDTSCPDIKKIYLNNESFKQGDTVNETPLFVAEVTDKLGVNMAGSGMGHDIQIIIDNSVLKTYTLNNFYIPSKTEKNAGIINYSIPELQEGEHTLEFRVWNILNNLATHTFKFIVEKNIQPKSYNLAVNSNPAKISSGTSFTLTHNKPENRVDVNISVFDLSGRLIWNYKECGTPELISAYEIPWDLKTDDGEEVQPGVYIYNATVKSENGTETTTARKMLVVK